MDLIQISDARTITKVWNGMVAAMRKGAQYEERVVGSRYGADPHRIIMRDDLGIWTTKGGEIKGRRWQHFGILPLPPRGNIGITVEINPTLGGSPTSSSGYLAKDSDGSLWICHTGRVGGGREGISKSAFMAWTDRDSVRMTRKGGAAIDVYPIAQVGSKSMLQQIAEFTHDVAQFKAGAKPRVTRVTPPFAGSDDESEGRTKVKSRGGYIQVRRHAMIRNALRDLIEQAGYKTARDVQRDIIVGKAARPDVEFELKPSRDSQSVYTGVGQLLMHNAVAPAKRRVLVVPSGLPADRLKAIRSLGIDVLAFTVRGRRLTVPDLPKFVPNAETAITLPSEMP